MAGIWTAEVQTLSITMECSFRQGCSAQFFYWAVIISVFCPEYCCGLRGVEVPRSEAEQQKQVLEHGRSEFLSCLYRGLVL